MPDSDSTLPPVPESRVVPKKRTRLSLVWIIPIVAAMAGAWVAVSRILNEGPTITIVFQSAEGLEASKTKVRYSGLDVGTITAIRLADDRQHVIATVQMNPKTNDFLVKDTKFWIVQPRVSGLNITGLATLISGDYIGMELGQSKESAKDFVALDAPPMVAGNAAGRFFVLKAPELGSLDRGTPIYFRQLQAGEVVSYELDKAGHGLDVRIFVQAPYDQYVAPNTRFWQASGIDMSVTTNGLHVQTESLMSILAGGIAFETPPTEQIQPPAAANTSFTLFSNRATAFHPAPKDPQDYVLVFKQSVRGLVAGAPVEVNGIMVGEVTEVKAQFDDKTLEFTVPVTIRMDPTRYGVTFLNMPTGENLAAARKAAWESLIAHGLRAQLRTGSIISGALYVALDFFPDASPVALDWSQKPVEFPTVPGQLEGIEASLSGIMKKLNQMQFKEISDDLRKTMGDADKTLVKLHETLGGVDKTVGGFGKTADGLDQTLAAARGTLTNADKMMGSADKMMGNAQQLIAPNSETVGQLDGMLQEARGAARALRLLADYLERQPESLITGKNGKAK